MPIPRPLILASLIALAALSDVSRSQPLASPPLNPAAPGAHSAIYDAEQFPAIRGEVERLSLTVRGDIDGFILKDGTEVKTAPRLSTQLAFAIKPGDQVTVHGLKAAALPLVRAVSITNENSHDTVIDDEITAMPNPAPPPRGAPPGALGGSSETSGRVRMALHGPQGEVNGVLLDSGVILRFPPDQSNKLSTVIQPHQPLIAEGVSISSALGTVLDVQQLGPSRDRLVTVAPIMPPMDDRGSASRRGRPSGPAAPPPSGASPAPGAMPLPPPPAG